MIDHLSYTHSLKNSGLNGIRTHDLYDTAAVLYQLSYQAIWPDVLFQILPLNLGQCFLLLATFHIT